MEHLKKHILPIAAGFCAGAANGLLGTGGGMLLVPLLNRSKEFTDEEIFPASVSVMLPVSIVTLFAGANWAVLSSSLLPCCLIGSTIGGLLAAKKQIPALWLHRILGVLILAGGVRFLC